MLIAGAGGHAIELLQEMIKGSGTESIHFFDGVHTDQKLVFNTFPVVHYDEEVRELFKSDDRFVLGVGDPILRKKLADHFESLGGSLTSVISPSATIGTFDVTLGRGLNILTGAVITNRIIIGDGTLIHVHCSIHHDAKIGSYSTISPGCRVLGRSEIGNNCFLGSNVVVLPGIHIGDHCIIGAGAVVTKSVVAGTKVMGIPARPQV